MNEFEKAKLEANYWIIKARWYYLAAFFVVGFIVGLNYFKQLPLLDALSNPVFITLLFPFIINGLFYSLARNIEKKEQAKNIPSLSFLQVFVEIVIISFVVFLSADILNIGIILFFIPIVESVILFEMPGTILVCATSAAIIVISGLLKSHLAITPESYRNIFYSLLVTSVVYAFLGFLSAYISNLMRHMRGDLKRETEIREVQLNELKNFNRELEKDTRELSAKELELTAANQRLEKLEEAKSKFVSVTTHQLRTPLSAIKWTFEMMSNGGLGPINDEQKDFLSKGYESTKRMIMIVNDLLNVDQVEADKVEYAFKPASFVELLDSVMFEFSNQAESKQIKLEVKKPDRTLPLIEMDSLKIRMVMENMIDNAIKYTPKQGSVTVTVGDEGLNTAQNSIEFTVSDSGVGIPKDEQSKIFSKFFRASTAIKIEPDGSGIGLYISKDIVEKHGGAIWFEDGPQGGTIFHFTLPIKRKTL